ncbi:unnamed protein product, partial [Auanema sp. JU1783]
MAKELHEALNAYNDARTAIIEYRCALTPELQEGFEQRMTIEQVDLKDLVAAAHNLSYKLMEKTMKMKEKKIQQDKPSWVEDLAKSITDTIEQQPKVGEKPAEVSQPTVTQPNTMTSQPTVTQPTITASQPSVAQPNFMAHQPSVAQQNFMASLPTVAQSNFMASQPMITQPNFMAYQPTATQPSYLASQ